MSRARCQSCAIVSATVPTPDEDPIRSAPPPRVPLNRACAIGAAVGFVPYLAVLWDFGVRPLRRMTANGINADFFDIQARALFHGHLSVPPGSLGIEAFVVDGRHYMYFPPLPAIMRMPILLVTDRLDGRLTALSMLAGWFVLAFALAWLFRLVRGTLRGDAPVGRLEALGVGTVMASLTGGSVMLFIASQPWVYHEVYVWSAALTVATAASLIAAWTDPTWRRVAVTGALALATMLTRLPAGWAMSLALIATGVWFLFARRSTADSVAWTRSGWGLIGGGAATIAVGSAINWAKFRHLYRFPIDKHVWSQFSVHRKIVLAFNDGQIDGPEFSWTTLLAYFRPDGVRFVSFFPFVTPPARPPRPVGDVLLDESFRTGSIPATMPLLFLLAVWGFVVVYRRRGGGTAALRIPLAGALLLTGGVIAFAYVAQRYTSEFIPVLAFGGSVGLVDLARRCQGRSWNGRRLVAGGLLALAGYGAVANLAIAVVNERQNWRGRPLEQLIGLQETVSRFTGHPLERMVREVEELPAEGPADELAILGDCDALYVGTGEDSGEWIPVQFRDRTFRLQVGDDGLRPGSLSLMWFSGYTLRRLHVQVGLEREIRVTLIGTPPDTSGRWLAAEPGDTVVVRVHGETARNLFVATATVERAGETVEQPESRVDAPMTEWDQRFVSVPISPHQALGSDQDAATIGVTVDAAPGPVPDLCDSLRS